MSKIVAKVEGKEISQDDVLKFIEEIGPQIAMQFQSADGIKTIIQEMINQELLLLDAKDSKMDQEEEFVKVFEETKNNLLKNYAFQKVIGNVKLDDEEVKNFFNDNKAVFAKELVDASHILVETEEKAKEIKAEIESGKKFEDAAQEHSSCPSKEVGGSLGKFPRGAMVPEFDKEVFELEIGKISEPVKTQFGYHLIRVNEKTNPDEIAFEDVEQEVRTEALRHKQQTAYLKKLEELNSKYNAEILDTEI